MDLKKKSVKIATSFLSSYFDWRVVFSLPFRLLGQFPGEEPPLLRCLRERQMRGRTGIAHTHTTGRCWFWHFRVAYSILLGCSTTVPPTTIAAPVGVGAGGVVVRFPYHRWRCTAAACSDRCTHRLDVSRCLYKSVEEEINGLLLTETGDGGKRAGWGRQGGREAKEMETGKSLRQGVALRTPPGTNRDTVCWRLEDFFYWMLRDQFQLFGCRFERGTGIN